MNDQKIYELMAKTPDIRAVQIADALDQDLTDVSDALKALVDEGDVTRTAGTAPNGQSAQIYNLSQTFMRTAEYKAIKAQLDAAPAVTSTGTVADSVPAVHAAAPKVSRVDSALAFIRFMGKVSSADLKQHMGIATGSPSNYLNAAMRDGRVARKRFSDGHYWVIGTGQDTRAVDSTPCLAKEAAGAGVDTAPVAQPGTPAFRCGLWSDNVLELQRDGVTLTTLTRGEGEHMATFFNRMLATTESA